ncbi:MAG: NADH-quinone oxidoreductase subunit J [Candidatus Kapaibacterium sp.]
MSLTFIFFAILGILAIASGIVTIASKNPIASALALVFHFFMLAGLYLTLNAQFLAVLQILVYAGAIMVLVIFVIMLLNLGEEETLALKFKYRQVFAIIFGLALCVTLVSAYLSATPEGAAAATLYEGTAGNIGQLLFVNYLFPFEAISLLLLTAIAGAVILAKRKID